MDAIGLLDAGTMSPEMRPIRPGIRFAGFAYTVKLLPGSRRVKACRTLDEYNEELGKWCADIYSFTAGLADGRGKDKVCVVDMDGYPGGLWGSDIGMGMMKNGLAGVVLDGACRDSHECNIEKVNAFCTKRSFNHVYGRLTCGGVQVPVRCAGVAVKPGDVVCADDDGVLVIPRDRAEEVLGFAEAILKADQKSRARHYRDLEYPPDETLGEEGG